jgi:hypothetical protein
MTLMNVDTVIETRTTDQAAQEDLFFGQSVIIWARWGVILAGTVLALWTSTSTTQLLRTIPFFLALMAMNFFLHGRYVMGSPLNRTAVIVGSVVDLAVITAIVAFWPGQDGLRSQFFVLYYPVVFAFALVFPRVIEAAYTAGTIIVYSGVCLAFGMSFQNTAADFKTLVMRIVVLAAMGFLGNYYFRIERERLRRAAQGAPSVLDELRTRARPAARARRRR